MASESELRELSSFFERVMSHRDMALFLPFLLGSTNSATASAMRESSNPEDPDQETPQTASPSERVILINPFTQGMVVIDGASNFESLIRDLAAKNGPPPASKASIEAMPSVEIGSDDEGGECAICLEEWELGGFVKEMPCEHKFHGICIEEWLGMHGSCPVCRYKMPVDEEGLGKKGEEGEGGREDGRIGREIWVTFSINGGRRNGDSNQTLGSDSSDVSASSPMTDHEMEG